MIAPDDADLDRLCIDTIRTLSIDTVQKANSGHPGPPMGAATMAYVLWTRHLRCDPADPAWPDRGSVPVGRRPRRQLRRPRRWRADALIPRVHLDLDVA